MSTTWQVVAGVDSAATSSEIRTVANNIDNVKTVGDNITNVNTVSGVSSNVTTVAGIASDVTTVATNNSNVNVVAGISSNVTSVAGVASLITSDFAADLNTLATSDIVADLNTLATADIVTDLNILATSDNVTNMATLGASGVVGNIASVAGVSSDVATVAGISSNVTTVAGVAANVTTVATNVTDVNNFANRYRVGSSDPTTSLDEGDLAYNSTDNALKYYNGTSWASITAGLTDIVGDVTPQLGGDLDCQTNNITNLGTLNTHTVPGGTGTIALTSDITFTASSTDTLTNKSGNISQWTNDSGYLTSFTETNDLSSAVTWANVPDANITQSSVTQHQAALSITESQISDLGAYITASSTDTLTNKSGNISMFTNDSGYITNTVSGDFTVDTDTLKVDSTNNRVGIGTTSPTNDLEIETSGDTNFMIRSGNSNWGRLHFADTDDTDVGRILYSHSNNNMYFYTADSEAMMIAANNDLHVDGDVIAYSTTISDVALKSDIQMIPNALDKIDEVRGVTFTRHNGQKSAGIIAQELEKVLPEAVREKELKLVDGKKYKTVEYDAIHGLLINCIKELKEQIKELKNGFTK